MGLKKKLKNLMNRYIISIRRKIKRSGKEVVKKQEEIK
jgi:hypothetical protein